MREEFKVVRIEAFANEPIVGKSGKGYTTSVEYTLEDGRKFPCHMRASRLKDLKVKLAVLPKNVDNIKVTVEAGVIVSSVTTWSIGGRGLVEQPV